MLDTTSTLKRTPFYARHVALGAKMVPFAGFEMPIQYEGIVAEHRTVRGGVGVFDVSHMGEIRLRGPGARAYANQLVTNQVDAIPDGKAVYTPMCLESGGIVDDLLVYATGSDRLLVVNAANFEKDLAWIRSHAPSDVTVVDENEETAQLAVQGPRAEDVVARIYGDRVRELEFYTFFEEGKGEDWTLVSRTGYTGEDGFEIYVKASRALQTWDRVFEAGAPALIRAIGLGARDTLRLEAKLPLYGNDIDDDHTPFEAGLGWAVKLDKLDFIGAAALRAQKATGVERQLVGFKIDEAARAIARHAYPVVDRAAGKVIGTVTSGGPGIWVGGAIGLAYVPVAYAKVGTQLAIDCRGRDATATVVSGKFYKRPQ